MLLVVCIAVIAILLVCTIDGVVILLLLQMDWRRAKICARPKGYLKER
jgi:hypothetical protein